MTRAKKNLYLSYYRNGFNEKPTSITSLLQKQLTTGSLTEVKIEKFDLPQFSGLKIPIHLDTEFLDLVKEKIEKGLLQIENSQTVTHEDVIAHFNKKWLK